LDERHRANKHLRVEISIGMIEEKKTPSFFPVTITLLLPLYSHDCQSPTTAGFKLKYHLPN